MSKQYCNNSDYFSKLHHELDSTVYTVISKILMFLIMILLKTDLEVMYMNICES